MAGKIDKSQPYAWDKALADRYDELEERANAPYDGAVGGLPDWVPEHFQIEFEETRNILFNSLSHAEILGYLQRFDKFLDPNYDGRELFPAQFIQRIGRLRCYQKAIALGKIDGLRFLAGDNAAKGAKFPAGGTQKKGKEGELKASIRKVVARINKVGFDAVMEYLKDDQHCEDIYYYGGVMFSRVDTQNRLLYYFDSKRSPDERQSVSFKRIRNILSEIK